MTSERDKLIEAVAKAMCCKHKCDARGRPYDPLRGSVPVCHARGFSDDAEQAITVIREWLAKVTPEMNNAGEANCRSWWTNGRTTPVYGHEPSFIFNAMLAASALAEGQSPTSPDPPREDA